MCDDHKGKLLEILSLSDDDQPRPNQITITIHNNHGKIQFGDIIVCNGGSGQSCPQTEKRRHNPE